LLFFSADFYLTTHPAALDARTFDSAQSKKGIPYSMGMLYTGQIFDEKCDSSIVF
jgi:hypothetical protein